MIQIGVIGAAIGEVDFGDEKDFRGCIWVVREMQSGDGISALSCSGADPGFNSRARCSVNAPLRSPVAQPILAAAMGRDVLLRTNPVANRSSNE